MARPNIKGLFGHLDTLRRILEEQQRLIAGQVAPGECRRRLTLAALVGMKCQRLEIALAQSGRPPAWLEGIRAVRTLAESVLRENPVLQAQGPVYVVRFEDIPNRYVLNRQMRRELRKGFGLHRRPKNDEGPSVVIALTPPGYEQMWHAHTVDEYTLVVDTPFLCRYVDGQVRELEARPGEMLHFAPHTYHTLVNRGRRTGRTLTAKNPLGMSLWLPGFDLSGTEPGSASVRSACPSSPKWGLRAWQFLVKDPYHDYAVDILSLQPGEEMAMASHQDEYLFVLGGGVEARWQRGKACASENDLLVTEPAARLCLQAQGAGARLYRVAEGATGSSPRDMPTEQAG